MPKPAAKLEAAGAAAGAFGARAPSFSFAFCTAFMSCHGDVVNSRTKDACWNGVPATHNFCQSYSALCDQQCIIVQVTNLSAPMLHTSHVEHT
jgi:hypothetical protein